jgi:hypothetical protein
VGNRLKDLGYEVTTLDIDPKVHAHLTRDILRWNYRKYPKKYFQLIAASVPCNEYSVAKTVGERNLQGADKIVQKVLEIIRYFQPDHWWIENPRTGLLKNRTYMQGLPFVDVDYCQYSMWGYRKPTRFWGSEEIVSRGGKICDLQTCPNSDISADGRKRHKRVLGGNENQVCTKLKGRVPAALIDHLLGRENDAPPRPPEILSGPWQTRPNPKGEGTSLKEVKVLPRMMMDVGIFQAGQIKKCGNALQLLMEIQTELPNRQLQVLDMLVDTGAEANIVKLGKLPGHLVYAAPKPLKFVTASGQRLRGGGYLHRLALGIRARG